MTSITKTLVSNAKDTLGNKLFNAAQSFGSAQVAETSLAEQLVHEGYSTRFLLAPSNELSDATPTSYSALMVAILSGFKALEAGTCAKSYVHLYSITADWFKNSIEAKRGALKATKDPKAKAAYSKEITLLINSNKVRSQATAKATTGMRNLAGNMISIRKANEKIAYLTANPSSSADAMKDHLDKFSYELKINSGFKLKINDGEKRFCQEQGDTKATEQGDTKAKAESTGKTPITVAKQHCKNLYCTLDSEENEVTADQLNITAKEYLTLLAILAKTLKV